MASCSVHEVMNTLRVIKNTNTFDSILKLQISGARNSDPLDYH